MLRCRSFGIVRPSLGFCLPEPFVQKDGKFSSPVPKKTVAPDHREFVSGFIRLHILHLASQEPLVGYWMIEELRRHGYEMSPGTIYPLLHSLQKKGYLSVEMKREGKRAWREYSATKEGKKVLNAAKRKLRELFHELME